METAIETYQTTRVKTAPRGHLVVILYDIIIRVLNGAVENIADQRYNDASKNILKAQNILSELLAYLNIEEGGEISASLYRLYKHFKTKLREASLSHDREAIKQLIQQTKELRTAWDEIVKAAKKTDQMNVNRRSVFNLII